MLAAAASALPQANVSPNAASHTVSDVSSDGVTVTPVSDVTTIPSGDRVRVSASTTYDQVPNACRLLFQTSGQGIEGGKQMAVRSTAIRG